MRYAALYNLLRYPCNWTFCQPKGCLAMPYMRMLVVLCGCLSLTLRPLQAEPVELVRQVLLADGKPAADAQIDIWIFDGATTRVQEHKTLHLPPDGWLHTQVEIPASPADTIVDDHMGRRAIYNRHYLVADAPGAPVVIVPLQPSTPQEPGWKQPLRLAGGGTIAGHVQGGGKPVAGAAVSVMWMNGILLGSLGGEVKNPALQAIADKDGAFALRPLRVEPIGYIHEQVTPLCSLLAQAKVDGSLLLGTVPEVSPVPLGNVADARYSPSIFLGGTWTARGRVTDELSGKAVEGARVEIASDSMWPVAPALTNARGEWEIGGIAPSFKVVAVATHAKTSVGRAIVGEPQNRLDEAARQPRLFDNVEIRVKPLAAFEGRVEDENTGTMPAPLFPNRKMASEVLVRYDWGEQMGNSKVGGGLVRAPIAADGHFSLALPLGQQTIGVSVPGYEATERPTLQIPAAGLKNVTLKIRKRPAFFIQLSHPRLAEMKDISVAEISDREYAPALVSDGLWYKFAQKWGDTLKIKVKKGTGRDMTTLLETVLTAKPDAWPNTVAKMRREKSGCEG